MTTSVPTPTDPTESAGLDDRRSALAVAGIAGACMTCLPVMAVVGGATAAGVLGAAALGVGGVLIAVVLALILGLVRRRASTAGDPHT